MSENDIQVYKEKTDEELIRMYRSGEDDVAEYLLEKYKPLVRMRARELYLVGGDREDLLQEGMLGLFKAIREYDETRGASFETFAGIVISRQMYSAIAAAQRQKHQPLNESVSISEIEENHEEIKLGLAESPESIIMQMENMQALRDQITRSLSKMEKTVFDLYLQGLDYTTIARKLDKSPKSIDNALQRIRQKSASVLGRR